MVCLSGSSSVLKESLSKLRGRPPTQFVHIQTDKVELTFLIVHGCWSVGEVVFFGLLDENGGTHFPRVSLVSNYSILNASNATAFGHKLLLSLSFTDYSIFQYIKRHMYISIGYIYIYIWVVCALKWCPTEWLPKLMYSVMVFIVNRENDSQNTAARHSLAKHWTTNFHWNTRLITKAEMCLQLYRTGKPNSI